MGVLEVLFFFLLSKVLVGSSSSVLASMEGSDPRQINRACEIMFLSELELISRAVQVLGKILLSRILSFMCLTYPEKVGRKTRVR